MAEVSNRSDQTLNSAVRGVDAGTTATRDVPALRSLSPSYEEDQHGEYVKILNAQLASGRDAPRNIALTGHYGSGKSSVLLETQRQLESRDVKVINLSLPSLGVGDGRIPSNGDNGLDKTNLIQKEIVKQLLYRRKPADMPASRYSRLDTFHVGRASVGAVGFGTAMTGFALLVKLPKQVGDALPPEAWTWINKHVWGNLAITVQWLSLLIVFVLTFVAALWVERLLQQRIRITELAAGPTKVTLSDNSSSYFDEYLDEIVYFFQVSKTAVVIFEDLDRFKDPHIFETLRELNLLLNNAEQTGPTTIQFLYAIRDSIFEQLDIDPASSDDEANEDGASVRQGDDTRRMMSTNRTKFFDLVVPMVPFISHRTSRDLIRQELEAIVPEQRPGNAVVDIVGAHLTDMRLIKNICNEFEVFRRRILAVGGLEELTPDRLFASIVYKNLYLADYEKIRFGTSQLDTLYGVYREWATQQTAAARRDERSARTRLAQIDGIDLQSARLGSRLQEILLARSHLNANASNVQISTGGTSYSWASLRTADFWRTYSENRGILTAHCQEGYQVENVSLPFEKVQTLMGYPLNSMDWTEDAKAEATRKIASAIADQRAAQHASMTDAIKETDRLFSYGGEDRSIADVADELFAEADVVVELLRAGFIDENFTLYITQFPGQAISASAMNFIIKAVQPDMTDIDYHFGAGGDVDTNDIEAVLGAEAVRLLSGQSIYNIELFDFLLATNPDQLDEPIQRLSAAAASDRTFIDAYLTSGAAAPAFVGRLSASWPGIFDYLIRQDAAAQTDALLDAALGGARAEVTYALTAEQRAALAVALSRLSTITTTQSAERAIEVANIIQQMGIHVEDLGVVAEPLRVEIATRSLYPVTLGNLRAILGEDGNLPLDRIKDARENDVYPHVLDHLPDYITALDQAADIPTITDYTRFAAVLVDIGTAHSEVIEEVAIRASADCVLDDLDEIDTPLWPALAAAQRLALSARNVAAYVAEYGIDSDLANSLTSSGVITLSSDDTTPTGPLALNILNSTALDDELKLRLVAGLGLQPRSIDASSLQKQARTMLPALVQAGLTPDDADAYTTLEDDEWAIKERLIDVSEEFPTYAVSLALSGNDLANIASRPVAATVKDLILRELRAFEANLGPRGASALADWAARNGRTLTAEAIVTLATKGGARCAQPILKLLGELATTVDIDPLKQALDALGKPWNQLTTPGRERPRVESTDGVAAVLTRLQTAGIVSKFEEDSNKHVFEVSKRHS